MLIIFAFLVQLYNALKISLSSICNREPVMVNLSYDNSKLYYVLYVNR